MSIGFRLWRPPRQRQSELPGYARERLRTKVRQALGRPTLKGCLDRRTIWNWRWVLGLAAAAMVILLFTMRSGRDEFVLQVAVLAALGTARANDANAVVTIHRVGPSVSIQRFIRSDELSSWETQPPPPSSRSYARIAYDRTAGEVRVSGKRHGNAFEKTFPVEPDLTATLARVDAFVKQQTGY